MFASKPMTQGPVKAAPAAKASKLMEMEDSDEIIVPAPKSAQKVKEVEIMKSAQKVKEAEVIVVKQTTPVKQAEPVPVFKPAKVDEKEVSPPRMSIA
jgi:uncharacterized protein with ACT and thioredoxin-like domain